MIRSNIFIKLYTYKTRKIMNNDDYGINQLDKEQVNK